MVVSQLSEPKVLEGVVSIGIVFAVIAENVGHVAGNRVVKTAKSMHGFISKRNGDDLKEKMNLVRKKMDDEHLTIGDF